MAESPMDLYLVGLRNAHAIEAMAGEMLERQIERIESYPEMAAALRTHLAETRQQSQRLDTILAAHASTPSMLKETWLATVGNVAALFHTVMADEIMKNHFANAAVEAFESAMYTALIAMAEAVGDIQALPALKQSLAEEQKTETLIQGMTPMLTTKYLERASVGEKAGI